MRRIKVIDKVVEYFSPKKAVERIAYRTKLDIIKNSGYSENGASITKNALRGWLANSRSPTEDINLNLPTLRQRSRDTFMSGGVGTAAIRLLRSNVVGSGLKLKCQLDFEMLGISEEEAKKWSRDVEKRFHFWANNKNCDIMGLNNFYELQSINFTATLLNGDSFTFLGYDESNNLQLNTVEADRISTPTDLEGILINEDVLELNNGNIIVSGIEFSKNGKTQAVYVCNTYNNYNKSWQRIEINNSYSGLPNVLHSFETERPGQTRGVPYLTHVLEPIKQLTRYTDAEILANIINSFFVAFIHTEDKGQMPLAQQVSEEDSILARQERANTYEIAPGAINVLGTNEKVTFGDPKRPSSSFDTFVTSMCKIIGSTLEIPYEMLLKTFNSSYSASRAALLESWKVFRAKREWVISDYCQKIYETWLFQQVATGVIKADGFLTDKLKRDLWCESMWIGSSPGQIDPVKEVNAAILRVENGFSTRAKEAQELTGTDFNANAKALKIENQLLGGGVQGNEPNKQDEQNGQVL